MGVEGLRWLSQDKALGSGGALLSFVSLSLRAPKALFYDPFLLVLQPVTTSAGNQELKRKPHSNPGSSAFKKYPQTSPTRAGFLARCLAAHSHSRPCEVEQTFALLNDSYSSVLFSLSLTVGAL